MSTCDISIQFRKRGRKVNAETRMCSSHGILLDFSPSSQLKSQKRKKRVWLVIHPRSNDVNSSRFTKRKSKIQASYAFALILLSAESVATWKRTLKNSPQAENWCSDLQDFWRKLRSPEGHQYLSSEVITIPCSAATNSPWPQGLKGLSIIHPLEITASDAILWFHPKDLCFGDAIFVWRIANDLCYHLSLSLSQSMVSRHVRQKYSHNNMLQFPPELNNTTNEAANAFIHMLNSHLHTKRESQLLCIRG